MILIQEPNGRTEKFPKYMDLRLTKVKVIEVYVYSVTSSTTFFFTALHGKDKCKKSTQPKININYHI